MRSDGPQERGWGNFDHDLKARAVRSTGTSRKRLGMSFRSSGGMTLPDDGPRPVPTDPQPDTAPGPVDTTPGPVDTTPEVLQREPLHFIVVLLLVADIIFGLGLAVFAERMLAYRPMAIMGCGLAALGLGVLAYFVLFGGGKRSRW
jgi:hypothetical protein